MPPRLFPDEHELRPHGSFDLDDTDFESDGPVTYSYTQKPYSLLPRIFQYLSPRWRRRRFSYGGRNTCQVAWRRRRCRQFGSLPLRRQLHILVSSFLLAVLSLLVFAFLFLPSYTYRPTHYDILRSLASNSNDPGRGNPRKEKVFIAASIYEDGSLISGKWGENVLELIQLLGPENTYLSVYENDNGDAAAAALKRFDGIVPCNHSVVHEPHLDTTNIQHITLPDGSARVKRIALLAEARNRALLPLEETDVQYDKLLFLNDVYFDPVEIVQLIFSTNADEQGVAQYRAACAVDFINPFKFYDTFASRDLGGYSMGLPFYPWFTNSGNAESRRDVLNQRDAVRVRSCWGGVVSFDAHFFQSPPSAPEAHVSQPARFRAEPDRYWDASECCLINADIQLSPYQSEEPIDTGIYMNPFIRVAYDTSTLSWLSFTRKFERLYAVPHAILNFFVGLPRFNYRRAEQTGDEIKEPAWVNDGEGGSSYETITRIAGTGGFCGRHALQIMKPNPKEGEKKWEMLPVPPQ